MLKTVVQLNIFVETVLLFFFFFDYLMSRKFKEQHLCEFIGNIINVFIYFWSI